MGSRWTSSAIVLSWLAMMGWLVATKVVPPLLVGDPPSYHQIVGQSAVNVPVCWSVHWNGRPLGFAATRMLRDEDGSTAVQSRLYLARLPVADLTPGWLGALLQGMLQRSGRLSMDALSRMDIDPLGQLMGFDTKVRVSGMGDVIRMTGVVEGSRLRTKFQSGDKTYSAGEALVLPKHSLLGDELSPQARLPGLRLGQSWTVPSYSPFPRQPTSPLEILQATVERVEVIDWNNRAIETLLVVYRNDSGSALVGSREARARLWVARDGRVLVQEVSVLTARIRFVRLDETRGGELAAELGEDWTADVLGYRGRHLLRRLTDRD